MPSTFLLKFAISVDILILFLLHTGQPAVRILVLAPTPIPVVDGHTLRVRHILANLPQGYEFDLICVGGPNEALRTTVSAADIGTTCRSVSFVPPGLHTDVRPGKPLWEKAYRVLFPDPLSPGYVISLAMKNELRRRVASKRYDLLFYCGVSMFLHEEGLNVTIPSLVDLGDSYSLYCKNELKNEFGLSRRYRALIDVVWANRYEKIHCAAAKNIVVITPLDRASLQQNCPNSRTWTVPNGVDTEYFRSSGDLRQGNHLLFTGVMDYEPNVNSIIYFIERILPRIQREIPDAKLTVAGRSPAPKLLAAAALDPGITITGGVPDLRPYFDQASVYVAPMISGAGLKNKILEAWSMSKPVVATSMACSGIEPVEGENVLIGDTSEEFARKVVEILRNPGLRNRMGACSRRTAEEKFSWAQQSQRFARIFDELMRPTP